MLCVVPLAGPDFYDPAYGAKPFVKVDGGTLIEATLGRRAWLLSGDLQPSDIVFILRSTAVTETARSRLDQLFPGSRSVCLSSPTGGALLSALAGAAFAGRGEGTFLVDLADLGFDATADLSRRLMRPVAGFIPWFRSSDPAFSYMGLDDDRVIETAEKRVISDAASAGVYSFATVSHFLAAAGGCLADPSAFLVNGAFYICPAYNVLISQGRRIEAGEVHNVKAYSKQFHATRVGAPAQAFFDKAGIVS